MQRAWKPNPSTLLPLIAFVLAPVYVVADAQEEQVRRRPTSDRDTAIAQVAATQGEIKPSDVFAHVALLRDELELVRSELGKPKNTRPEIEVVDVAPRGVFFQAQTLFRKADDLCFEVARHRATPPGIPKGEIRPEHVWLVVDAAL